MNVNQHHHHHQTNNVVGGTLITTNGQIGTIQTSQGPMQIQLNRPPPPPPNDMITGYGTIGGTHPHHPHHVDHSTTTYHLVGPDGTLISVCIIIIRYSFIFYLFLNS